MKNVSLPPVNKLKAQYQWEEPKELSAMEKAILAAKGGCQSEDVAPRDDRSRRKAARRERDYSRRGDETRRHDDRGQTKRGDDAYRRQGRSNRDQRDDSNGRRSRSRSLRRRR